MQRNSKTLKEIYKEKYPIKEIVKSPLLCSEAIGYLEGILQFNPCEEWVKGEMLSLEFIIMVALE